MICSQPCQAPDTFWRHLTPCTMRRGDYVAKIDGLTEDKSMLIDILPMDALSKPITDEMLVGHLSIAYRMKLEHLMFFAQAREARIWLYQDGSREKMKANRVLQNPVNVAWMLVGWEQFHRHVVRGQLLEYDRTGTAKL